MGGSYLGIDAHATTGLELAALSDPGGELLWRDRCPLDRRRIVAAVKRAPAPCRVVFEEGELATWLHQVIEGSCERVLAADPRRNRLIATSPHKSDEFDARALAKLALGGYIKEVFQPPKAFADLRMLVRHQGRLRDRSTRLKNQIKALFRQRGLVARGQRVYVSARQLWLERLPGGVRELVADHFLELDANQEALKTNVKRIDEMAKAFPPVVRLCTIPQVGALTAATFVAYVVTPERFPGRKKLWTYCGYGLMEPESGSSKGPVRLRRDRNAELKRLIKTAVVNTCKYPDLRLGASYRAKVAKGVEPDHAKLTIGRRLINIMATLWSRKLEYDPDKVPVS